MSRNFIYSICRSRNTIIIISDIFHGNALVCDFIKNRNINNNNGRNKWKRTKNNPIKEKHLISPVIRKKYISENRYTVAWKKRQRNEKNAHQEVLTLKSTPNKHTHRRTVGPCSTHSHLKDTKLVKLRTKNTQMDQRKRIKWRSVCTGMGTGTSTNVSVCPMCIPFRFVLFQFFMCTPQVPSFIFQTNDKSIYPHRKKNVTKSTAFSRLASMRF